MNPDNTYYKQCQYYNINNQAHHYRVRNFKINKCYNQGKHNVGSSYKIPFMYIPFIIFNKFITIHSLIIITSIKFIHVNWHSLIIHY